ncbi:sugar ABC transporter substrate-binding protein [Paenibacillus glucanolyticus]|jgi:putative aldouronate transport system substrate-binding protein|uniref:ABC transporter substrate-binding protein n=1 Tax=Paenibacillus TaxID=44249 RepID=UPI0003E28881|nr:MULTISPECIES: extracellular solute-binding protein [Paenibacillus]ANA81225.1 sugar ABC transporter substrate-binding protein [Paenibacillus glucanolyticus]AVV54656.1 sugar ABC transporter substrate-binding protein [Paenibacillus glucanolyticus]ETT35815.1 family 1 extracellular solute-binding protein [Paenibacillus sp. FSL R5-808]OMF66156.1 sugar ABC transporter substrate-binding protein [Paenibacillus glucanolyticus]
MKKNPRSFWGKAFLLSLIVVVLAACNDKTGGKEAEVQDKGAMETYAVGDAFKATEPFDLSILYSDQPAYPYKQDWMLFAKLKEMTNVTLKPTIVPMSDYSQKRSLLISSGDAPLVIPKTYPGEESAFVASGAILPISDYIDLMPNFKDKVEKWDMDSELEGLRQEDKKYYVLPGLHEAVWPDYTLIVRKDIFEKHGIAIPTTWDELYTAMKQLKQEYPDVTPFSDRFKFNSTLNIAATGFGTKAGWGFGSGLTYLEDKDEFVYTATTEEYKEMLTYFHKLVAEGLLDKESFTQDDDQAVQKFVSGKSFIINGNSQTVVQHRNDMDKTLGEGKYAISKITVPGGPAGQLMSGSRLENGVMISSKVKESEHFKAILQFIDWLYYSDEGQEFAKWGVEGVTYTKEGGVRKLMDDINYNGLNPKGTKDLRIENGFSGGVFAYGGTTELLQSMFSEEEQQFQKSMSETKTVVKPEPPIPYSVEERERVTLLSTPLKDYTDQNTLKFILGDRDLADYDKFVAELDSQGVGQYLEIANKTYKTYKEQK